MAKKRNEERYVHEELNDIDEEVHVQDDNSLALPLSVEGQIVAIQSMFGHHSEDGNAEKAILEREEDHYRGGLSPDFRSAIVEGEYVPRE